MRFNVKKIIVIGNKCRNTKKDFSIYFSFLNNLKCDRLLNNRSSIFYKQKKIFEWISLNSFNWSVLFYVIEETIFFWTAVASYVL